MRKRSAFSLRYGLLLLSIFSLLGGCSTPMPRYSPRNYAYPYPAALHEEVVAIARKMLGTPYHYGGDTPKQGFDCSGLVYYAHLKAGVRLPRTSYGQFEASRPVSLRNLHPGDLVFFRMHRYRVSHVGIYIGHHEFIHAPSHGQDVMIDNLMDPYWHRRFVRGGRIL